MLRFLRNIFLAFIIVALLIAGLLFWSLGYGDRKDIQSPTLATSKTEIPSLDVLLVQVHDSSNTRQILSCNELGCTAKVAPESAENAPLSDGTTWYRYAVHEDKQKKPVTVLEKIAQDGSVEKISEENALVRPRSMFLSTDGTKLAYFLDNIHDKLGLTELWVYDSVEGGARVAAENLMSKDIASRLRWNASSRVAWFLQDGTKKQFMTVDLHGKSTAVSRFQNIDWYDHADTADAGIMDVNDDQNLIAFSEPSFFGYSHLVVAQDGGTVTKKTVRGKVVFVRWMQDNALFYAVQDGQNLAFWSANNKGERPIARMSAEFKSAHSSGSSNLAAFVADPRPGESHLYVLQISTGIVKDQIMLPRFMGVTHLVQANEAKTEQRQAVAGITTQVEDGVLLAFVNNHMGEMAIDKTAKATRMLTTDSPNTMYLDYVGEGGTEKRMLVVIKDVIHPEWTILAHYKPLSGQWKREQEAIGADPKAVRLYEWEEALSQWILKESY